MIRIDFELLYLLPRLLVPEGNPNHWLETENEEQRERLERAIATFLPFIYKLLLYCYGSTKYKYNNI